MHLPRLRSDTLALCLLAALLLLPQLVTDVHGRGRLGWARVTGGDEPHYLVLVHSVLEDGDLDLKNNYLAVHDGSPAAGGRFAGSGIDHHTAWYVGGERRIWAELFQPAVFAWPRDAQGQRLPQVRPGVDRELADGPEYSAHPVGIALLTAPLLLPFRHDGVWLERAALLLAGLATVGAMLLMRQLLASFSASREAILLTLVAVFLGTPVLYYSRTFFNEPFLVLCVVGAFAMGVHPTRALWAGCFVAAGMLMKPQLVLLLGPLGVPLLVRREVRPLLLLGVAPLLAGLLTLWLNAQMYGSPWRGPYPFYRGDVLAGAVRLWVDARHGLLPFTPLLLLVPLGWVTLVRQQPLRASMVLAAFGGVFLLTAAWRYWEGGWCFGPRLLVPVVPLLGVGLVKVFEAPLFQRFGPRFVLFNLLAVSCLVNVLGVTRPWAGPEQTPVQLVVHLLLDGLP